MDGRAPLRKVGGIWKPRSNGRSKGSGSISVNGYKLRFIILPNDHKRDGDKQPDYVLMSGEEPEVDTFRPGAVGASRSARAQPARRSAVDDDIDF
jgi:hypothetical protein